MALWATLPPVTAMVVQSFFWLTMARWSLFYPAVFLSSWLGGYRSGIASTLLSTALLWWYVVPPSHSLVKSDPRTFLGAAIFVVMGVVVSTLHRRLRRVTADAADAFRSARQTAERLQQVVDERRKLKELIDNSTDFIALADEHGVPTYMNAAGRQLIGLARNFPVGTTRIPQYFPADLRGFAKDVIVAETLARGQWQGETALRHWHTQEEIPVWVHAFQLRDPDTHRLTGIGTVTRDISAPKRTREALEAANRRLTDATHDLAENQRFLQAILDHSPNGIVIKDLQGRYLIVNQGLETLTGVSAATSKGKTDFDLFPKTVAERFRANDKKVLETAAPLETEERTELKDSARVFLVSKFPLLDDRRRVFAICAIWTDITERKRAEELLRRNATDLRQAQHVARVGSWSWDLREKMEWSEETYRIFGRDPEVPLPVPFTPGADVFTPESTQLLAGAVEKLVRGDGPYELELEFIRPDRTTGWVAARGENVKDPATGKVVAITGTVEDITQLKDLQRLREEWTSVIAHDLRQPIGFIAMASDFLPTLHNGEMSPREKDMADRIRGAALTLTRMVDDLLDMSLLAADRLKLERDWVDPRLLVRDTVERLSHLTSDHPVKVQESRDLMPVFVDPMRIGQVLGNLVSNAAKYGDEHGEIVLDLARRDGVVEISVTNHGKGIDPEDLPRIFSRFMRSKATRRTGVHGLGLGLYIAKGVVNAHGGKMWAESTPGETTTFHVTLPTGVASQEAA